jgi:hypothetical protein
MTEKTDRTAELLRAILAASEEKKDHVLRILRGEVPESPAKPLVGPLLMGMGAAARFVGISRSTLWRILQAGTIEKVELFPGSFRVRREDLIKLAEGGFGCSGKVSRRGRPKKGSPPSTPASAGELRRGDSASAESDARRDDPRFQQLKALADEGNEEAAADLFKEFGFDHAAGTFGDPRTSRTARTNGTSGTHGQEIRA